MTPRHGGPGRDVPIREHSASAGAVSGWCRMGARPVVAVVAMALMMMLVGCSSSDPGRAPQNGAGSGSDPGTGSNDATAGAPATEPLAAGRARLTGFKEVTVTIVGPDGRSRTVCLLLADTEATRERGLMYVVDPSLGGYDGMLFAFDEDVRGGFWMKNTKLPLSIAYVAADGSTVNTTDMEPCPATAATCPSYPAAGTYRYAIEVPKGRLADIGITDGSRLSVGASTCAPSSSVPSSRAAT